MRSYVTIELDIIHEENLSQGSMVAGFIAEEAARLLTERLAKADPFLSIRAKVVTAWVEHRADK